MKITMTGGSPWGFKMTGGHDFRQPLAIGKVTAGSKAARAGIIEGHHILTVNGEDVTNLAHLDAQNRIKAAKTTIILELSNVPVPKAAPVEAYPAPPPPQVSYPAPPRHVSYTAPAKPSVTYNNKSYAPAKSSSSFPPPHSAKMSTPRSPTAYSPPHTKTPSYEEQKNTTPDIEYRPVDSRDSYRRMYDEIPKDSEWAPTVHQSTLQSPSMKALARSSGAYDANGEEVQDIAITEEIRDMILEDETDGRQNGHQDATGLRRTGIKVVEPPQQYINRRPSNPTPAPYSNPDFVQPRTSHSSDSSYSSQSSYGSQTSYNSPSQPQPAKSKAIGNISKFLQSSGAKQGQPEFAKKLNDLQCPYGDPAVLEIRIGNTLPVPTVSWYHNDKPIKESKEKDINFLSKGIVHTLVFGEFGPELAGRYKCVLTNRHGSASCGSILMVEQPHNNPAYAQPAPVVPAPTYNNSSPRGYTSTYQAPVNNSYQPPTRTTTTTTRPPVASNSAGLYSQNTAREAYTARTANKVEKDDQEESEVMRALRAEGQDENRPRHQSRSMRMLEETLGPESEDL